MLTNFGKSNFDVAQTAAVPDADREISFFADTLLAVVDWTFLLGPRGGALRIRADTKLRFVSGETGPRVPVNPRPARRYFFVYRRYAGNLRYRPGSDFFLRRLRFKKWLLPFG